jgi:hypothetical protein
MLFSNDAGRDSNSRQKGSSPRHTAVEGKLSDREMCPLTPFRWWP